MDGEKTYEMNFEQFLRGRLNARSENIPRSLNEAIQNPDLPEEYKLFFGQTLKNRLNVIDATTDELLTGERAVADESFSIGPITTEQENQLEAHARQFYEAKGYELYDKRSSGLSDTYLFRNTSGDIMAVTYTLPFHNESENLLVSSSPVRAD